MLIPALVNASDSDPLSNWKNFVSSSLICCFFGISLFLITRGSIAKLDIKQSFILTTASWIVTAIFASLPFYFNSPGMTITDSFFEAMSGITTTGSTIIVNLDNTSKGILLWRAILQWLGGIGFVILAITVLPMLKVGGNQVFQSEFSDASSRTRHKITSLASWIGSIYLALTIICSLSYWAAGMSGFNAIVHSMTTIATGGFSTSDLSIGLFSNIYIEIIAIIFMILGSLPFIIYVTTLSGNINSVLKDTQIKWFFCVLIFFILIVCLWQMNYNETKFSVALRESAFNVTSILTGTGYATSDYWKWGTFPSVVFLFLMFIGGCAGSTSCSIKIFRYQILFSTMKSQIIKLVRPHQVYVPTYNGNPISENITDTVFAFFFLFLLSFSLLALSLSAIGLDFVTSISSAATAITNVGPGLGSLVGPASTFAELPNAAKWVMSIGMLIGRLEIFIIITIFTRSFWNS
ncbi:TrkH family potassium uptake protein [Alphaproteobacteria bacterium]|nr:TrkH family potassium uptake protein [Alphaproteobacteria bacterium]